MTRPFSDKAPADGVEQLVAGGIEEAAGVDDDQIGAVMLARDLVAFGAQARDDALGIDQRLRASEADETDAWGGGHGLCFRSFNSKIPRSCRPFGRDHAANKG